MICFQDFPSTTTTTDRHAMLHVDTLVSSALLLQLSVTLALPVAPDSHPRPFAALSKNVVGHGHARGSLAVHLPSITDKSHELPLRLAAPRQAAVPINAAYLVEYSGEKARARPIKDRLRNMINKSRPRRRQSSGQGAARASDKQHAALGGAHTADMHRSVQADQQAAAPPTQAYLEDPNHKQLTEHGRAALANMRAHLFMEDDAPVDTRRDVQQTSPMHLDGHLHPGYGALLHASPEAGPAHSIGRDDRHHKDMPKQTQPSPVGPERAAPAEQGSASVETDTHGGDYRSAMMAGQRYLSVFEMLGDAVIDGTGRQFKSRKRRREVRGDILKALTKEQVRRVLTYDPKEVNEVLREVVHAVSAE